MMARAGGTAASRLSDTSADTPADPAFMQAKMTTSRVFMTHHLPQVQALAAIIMTGDSAVLGMDAEWL
jgi:hypothetical protein